MGCGSCANENAIKAAMIRYQVAIAVLYKIPVRYSRLHINRSCIGI